MNTIAYDCPIIALQYPGDFSMLHLAQTYTAVTFWFGVSENDGTRAYIFVNIWKSLGQIAPL